MDDSVPGIYIAPRKMSEEQLAVIQHALSLTPIDEVLVDTAHDLVTARNLCDRVILTPDPEAVARLYAPHGFRCLILGDVEQLTAVYEDGRREIVEC